MSAAEPMRILMRAADGERHIAVLCGGKLVEYHCETAGQSLVGATLLGRVERVLPAMKAAFVNIGQKLNGFLPFAEQESFEQTQGRKPVATGQTVVVQVKKDPKGDKGAFLTRDITLAGYYAIVMPYNRHVGVSSRVTDEGERESLIAMGKAVTQERFGVIVRHAALCARETELREECEGLLARWEERLQKAEYEKTPSVLLHEDSCLPALIRDFSARHELTVLRDEGDEAQTELEMEALWRGARVEEQLKHALSRKVDLANGGTLVIDEREALTTVDVNSGRFVGGRETKEFAFVQNMAACAEIARQIRLRNLGGILLLDFIDMQDDAQRTQVREALENELRDDRIKTAIHGFTSLGLLEMTRKRTRDSLQRTLTTACTACGETGRRRNPANGKEPKL